MTWPAMPGVCATAASAPEATATARTQARPDDQSMAIAALDTLHFTVKCVQLVETARFPSLRASDAFATPASHPALSCKSIDGPSRLVGKGQIIVLVDASEYDQAVKSAAAQNLKDTDGPALVLNGFNLGKGAKLIAVERSNVDEPGQPSHFAALRYQLVPDDDSEDAWSTLYQEVGLLRAADLRAALSWKNLTVFAADPDGRKLTIAISDWWTLAPAFGISALMLAFYVWALARTDLFRSYSSFPWWLEAQRLRRAVKRALRKSKDWKTIGLVDSDISTQANRMAGFLEALRLKNAAVQGQSFAEPGLDQGDTTFLIAVREDANAAAMHAGLAKTDAQQRLLLCPKVLALLRDSAFGGPSFTNDQVPVCLALAQAALEGSFPDTPLKVNQTVIGLSLHRKRIPVVRAAFSLVAVQVGTWVTFACLVAVFLWLVFGHWPVLKGSMLALVAISAMTATASWFVDPGSKSFLPSVNLLVDLATGSDSEQRVHRFQAVMVNVLLLFIGTAFVVQHLAYPTFDSSWLEFLGLSGILQTAGKRLLER